MLFPTLPQRYVPFPSQCLVHPAQNFRAFFTILKILLVSFSIITILKILFPFCNFCVAFLIELWYDISRSFPKPTQKGWQKHMSRKFACLYLAVALLVSSIWIASADERDTVQQEVQYSAAVEALDAAGLTSRSSNVLPSRPVRPRRTPPAASRRTPPQPPLTPPPRRPPVRAC